MLRGSPKAFQLQSFHSHLVLATGSSVDGSLPTIASWFTPKLPLGLHQKVTSGSTPKLPLGLHVPSLY
jgi:hypothetical protein